MGGADWRNRVQFAGMEGGGVTVEAVVVGEGEIGVETELRGRGVLGARGRAFGGVITWLDPEWRVTQESSRRFAMLRKSFGDEEEFGAGPGERSPLKTSNVPLDDGCMRYGDW